jgi:nucleoside-diphosphate-sugar epimerase
MRIMVTGVGGFIGSQLAEALLAAGHDVIGVDAFTAYYDPARKRRNLQRALQHDAFKLVEGDLNQLELPAQLDGVDVVHHLAGQPGVRVSWGREFEIYLAQNVLSTQRLLEAAKAVGLPRLVLASSSSVYGQAERFPTSEDDLPRPVSPYGLSKLAAEHLCHLYASQFGVESVILRYFSIFGPRQRPDMAFARFIEGLLGGAPLTVYGDGGQGRDFTYVGDVVAATIAAGERGVPGRTYNVAGGCQATVMEVIEILGRLMEQSPQLDRRPALAGDPRQTGADVTRARADLGFQAAVGLEEGLARQLEEHRARQQGEIAPA